MANETKKSFVWDNFAVAKDSGVLCDHCCNHSEKSYSSTGSKLSRTSYITTGACKGKTAQTSDTSDSMSGAGGTLKRLKRGPLVEFDADHARLEIAKMFFDCPLLMVEHPQFLTFIQTLQPRFDTVSLDTIREDCVKLYRMWKENLQRSLDSIRGRVSLSLDMWTSSKSVGYVFVTGHFVDKDWNLQRRLLNVVMEPFPNSDNALSHALAFCLSEWNLKNKLFSVTVNQNLSQAAIEGLRSHLEKSQLIVGCIVSTFCAIASDILEEGKETVTKVRESVKYVKTSDSNEKKFVELKQRFHVVSSERSLAIDDTTQWNSTYQMLVAASELKEVFSCLDMSYPGYRALSNDEWKQIEIICSHLKLLHGAANVLTTAIAAMKPSPFLFFGEVWKIKMELSRRVAANEDPFSGSLSKRMLQRVDTYWKSCSLALATAVVMDPRYKMDLVEFCFKKIYGKEAPVFNKMVEDEIRELFLEYEALPLHVTSTDVEEGNSGNIESNEDYWPGICFPGFSKYLKEKETRICLMKPVLDMYFDDNLLPDVQDFDTLEWWKLRKIRFSKLSKMAGDVLAMPFFTASSDSLFRTGVKEIDSYWNSLSPEMVQALTCAKDWMHHADICK